MFRKIVFFISVSIFLGLYSYARDIDVYFTPSYKAEGAIEDLIDNANKTIDIAMYTFTSRYLAQHLIDAENRGVKIRVLLDRKSNDPKENEYTKYLYLKKNGINIRFAAAHTYKRWKRSGIMHNKFAIFDNKIVETGSLNWTASAFVVNDENVLVIRRQDIANVYEGKFEALWEKAKEK